MAVRHGYGKIAGTDALVFAYDTGDTRNSYRGEPTTNLFTDPLLFTDNSPNASGPWLNYNATYSLSTDTYNNGVGFSQRLQDSAGGTTFRNSGIRFTLNITTGVTYTLSFYGKNLDTITGISWYDIGWDTRVITKTPLSDGWSYYSVELLSNSDTSPILYIRPEGNNVAYGFDSLIYKPQFEQKSHATPFVNGTRSTTQGLLDLTGNNTIDLSNVSFDSNAQKTFDGTDDQFIINNPGVGTSFTVETIIKANDYSNSPMFISPNSVGIDHFFRISSSGTVFARFIEVADSVSDNYTSTTVLNTTDYYHVVMSKSPTNGTIYVNGVAEDSHTPTLQAVAWSGNWKIGARYNNTFWFDGEIPILKVYTRALTPSEVQSNYRHYKKRFNI